MPCGFCGRSGCTVSLESTSRNSWKVVSNCTHFYKFNVGSTASVSVNNPCTNVPVICPIGGCAPNKSRGVKLFPAIWKYNFPEHIQQSHSSLLGQPLPEPLATLGAEIHISREEQQLLKIPEASIIDDGYSDNGTQSAPRKRSRQSQGGQQKQKQPRLSSTLP